ncbi:uncharacterized protein KZ484_021256 [Pholidichthys leucotaenia]
MNLFVVTVKERWADEAAISSARDCSDEEPSTRTSSGTGTAGEELIPGRPQSYEKASIWTHKTACQVDTEQYTSSRMLSGAGGRVTQSISKESPLIFQPWAISGGNSSCSDIPETLLDLSGSFCLVLN